MNIKKLFRYTFFAALGIFLVYYASLGVSWEQLIETSKKVKPVWVLLAVLAHLINHFFRALRWRLFVQVQQYNLSRKNAFFAEMSGFCMNLIPPRTGEWVRCVVLKRLEGIPITKSFGGVVVERFIDVFLFLCLFGIAFLNAFMMNYAFFSPLRRLKSIADIVPASTLFFLGVALFLGLGVILYRFQKEFLELVWHSIKRFFKEVWEAIVQIRKCNSTVVWTISLFILLFHFMVEYLSFFAIEGMDIDWKGALYVFLVMNVGMSAPTPGGLGVYHLGVISTLMALGVESKYAILYAFITHGIQIFNALVIGGSCFLIANFLPSKQREHIDPEAQH